MRKRWTRIAPLWWIHTAGRFGLPKHGSFGLLTRLLVHQPNAQPPQACLHLRECWRRYHQRSGQVVSRQCRVATAAAAGEAATTQRVVLDAGRVQGAMVHCGRSESASCGEGVEEHRWPDAGVRWRAGLRLTLQQPCHDWRFHHTISGWCMRATVFDNYTVSTSHSHCWERVVSEPGLFSGNRVVAASHRPRTQRTGPRQRTRVAVPWLVERGTQAVEHLHTVVECWSQRMCLSPRTRQAFFPGTSAALHNEQCDCFRPDNSWKSVSAENRYYAHAESGARLTYYQSWGNRPLQGHTADAFQVGAPGGGAVGST